MAEKPIMLTRWQRLRTKTYLTYVGMRRRVTLGARVALIDGDKVFLIRHTYLPGWQFPGGGVEPGESAATAAARELFEETGFRPTAPLELVGLYHNANLVTNRDHIAFFACRQFEAARPFKPDLEIAEGGWFNRQSLPGPIAPGAARRLDEIFGDMPRSETW